MLVLHGSCEVKPLMQYLREALSHMPCLDLAARSMTKRHACCSE